jgi:hypothetical protein
MIAPRQAALDRMRFWCLPTPKTEGNLVRRATRARQRCFNPRFIDVAAICLVGPQSKQEAGEVSESNPLNRNCLAALKNPDSDLAYVNLFRAANRSGDAALARRALDGMLVCGEFLGRTHELFGAAVLRAFPNVGRINQSIDSATAASGIQPVFVLGSSHARSFADGMSFIPFMMGSANDVCFLSNAHADRTRRVVEAHLDRIDSEAQVLLVLSNSDCITLDTEIEDAIEEEIRGDAVARDRVLADGARRYGEMLCDLVQQYPRIRFSVLDATPMVTQRGCRLAVITNRVIDPICKSINVPFVQVFDELLDRKTGILNIEYSVAPNDEHLSKRAIAVLREALSQEIELPEAGEFTWGALFRFSLSRDIETRIWSEPYIGPENVVHSKNVARGVILEKIARLISTLARITNSETVCIQNCGEGALALILPAAKFRKITACDPDKARLAMARHLARFARRSEVCFLDEKYDERDAAGSDLLVDLAGLYSGTWTNYRGADERLAGARHAFVLESAAIHPAVNPNDVIIELTDPVSSQQFDPMRLRYINGLAR